MNNLQKFKECEIMENELAKIKGGGIYDWVAGYLFGKAVDWSRKNIFNDEAMYKYGKRMLDTGSPGGHK